MLFASCCCDMWNELRCCVLSLRFCCVGCNRDGCVGMWVIGFGELNIISSRQGGVIVGIVHEFDNIQHYRTREAETQEQVGSEWGWQGTGAGVASTEQDRGLKGKEGSGGGQQQVGVQCGGREEGNAVSDEGQ